MKNSDLFTLLTNVEGVINVEEEKFKLVDDDNYHAFGGFDFSSDKDDEPLKIIYGLFKRPNAYCISLSISFVFEQLEKKLSNEEILSLIDEHNKYAIGIKSHSLSQGVDDELNISLSTEFYLPSIVDFSSPLLNQLIYTNLRFLENAPVSFSEHMKAKGIKHDFLLMRD
ncbi:hypothetical protein ACXZBD_23635 [Escherichia coli]|uniref:Uncharacterized protein n=1 Tax=Escherichia coli TaxID=562 RepID=A0A895NS27_ECOLX|nr:MULTISPECIES: hypothetical protein [Escherichia]AWJ01805.1 hypothetical protein DEF50_21280 [Escherichia coli]EFO3360496.1 hypothetical protein [Escherichia coli]EGF7343970.1 hypothetical protein [Escherichia coli]EHD5888506.1 hypothetical protein [Escherichia coli]EHW7203599.1 hypothetical protein [Escherichia coli]